MYPFFVSLVFLRCHFFQSVDLTALCNISVCLEVMGLLYFTSAHNNKWKHIQSEVSGKK